MSVKFVLNHSGVVELLQSAEAQQMVASYAAQVASGSGIDTDIETLISGDRAAARVKTASDRAARENLENNSLLKGMGNG